MVAVAIRQKNHAGAVKVHPAVVDKIRVVIRKHATGMEPDFAAVLVNPVDAAHHPLAGGNRCHLSAGPGIDQVEMPPSAAFGGMDQAVGFFEPRDGIEVQAFGMGGPDEGRDFRQSDCVRRRCANRFPPRGSAGARDQPVNRQTGDRPSTSGGADAATRAPTCLRPASFACD